MAELDHWHPVLMSDALGKKPVGVKLAGQEIVVFRGENGRAAALGDRCPHRGMPLREGRVLGDRVVCAYHGWSWGRSGDGTSPGNPKVSGCAQAFDTVERLGAVWIKRAGSHVPFPVFDVSGHQEIGRFQRRVKAPLELLLDNFIEVEHTGSVHLLLGYETSRMTEVACEVTIEDDEVRVYNRGPQRRLPWPVRKLFGLGDRDDFVDDWVTRFSPVHSIYDQYWIDPSGERRPECLRIAVFMNPIDGDETELFVFVYGSQPERSAIGARLLLAPLTRLFVNLEIELDSRLVEKLVGASTTLKGQALGRFDKALVAARKRVERIYRGRQGDDAGDS